MKENVSKQLSAGGGGWCVERGFWTFFICTNINIITKSIQNGVFVDLFDK